MKNKKFKMRDKKRKFCLHGGCPRTLDVRLLDGSVSRCNEIVVSFRLADMFPELIEGPDLAFETISLFAL